MKMKGFVAIIVVGGMIGCGVYILSKPGLSTSVITYNGYNFIPIQLIKTVFQPIQNKNFLYAIFRMPFLKKQLLYGYPQIDQLHYRLRFPSQLTIAIQEKKPQLLFVTENSHYFVSEDGTILNRYNQQPMIQNADKIIIIKGLQSKIFLNDSMPISILTNIQTITVQLKKYFANQNLQISINLEQDLTLIKDDCLPIKIGTSDELDQKFQNLSHFLAFLSTEPTLNRTLRYIDLRCSGKVVAAYWENNDGL